ncbi:MAG: SUMF1/EgtB/PvdO family nonheme iron enzyme [Chloroflexota bacterium]
MKLFISYSRDDKNIVYELANDLRDESNHSVWIDKAQLIGGVDWWKTILDGIDECECFVFTMSPRYMASIYCMAELEYAQALQKPILPLKLKESDLPQSLQAIQFENISELTLDKAMRRCDRALYNIQRQIDHNAYPAPITLPRRPSVPKLKAADPQNPYELFAEANQAVANGDSPKAESLLQKVIDSGSPDLIAIAVEMLAELRLDQKRVAAYTQIIKLAENPATLAGAKRLWRVYVKEYGTSYDPRDYATKLADAPQVAEPRQTQTRPKDSIYESPDPLYNTIARKASTRKFTLPLLEWINIPKGRVTLENKAGTYDVAPFAIAKYLVTNQQYEAFIGDGGYQEDRWWKDLAGGKQTPKNPEWNTSNHPRETVNWYEAIAFSRWLAAKTELPITLPTEMQWQWAAIKDTGWDYPYGKTFDKTKCNTKESGKGQTTPVDRYPQGASPFGVLDMSGNVWEWTLTEYESPKSNNITNNLARVVRGGSWLGVQVLARTAFRHGSTPDDRLGLIGFRVVCSVPLP